MINGKTKLMCLIGSPISHSFSPIMHNDSLEKCNINAKYLAFDVDNSNLENAINGLKAFNFIGANVTIPNKIEVMKHLDAIDEKAMKIGAVNTIVNVNNKLIGYNTDIDGFINSFKARNIELLNKSVAIFGAGGAAKGVVVGLLSEKVSNIDVFSRNLDKVKTFVDGFNDIKVFAGTYDKFDEKTSYDIIVNTTPIGTHPNIDDSIMDTSNIGGANTIFYDLIYNPTETKFLRDARLSGRRTINGVDMLILQGIKSFQHWFPNVDIEDKVTLNSVNGLLKENNII